MASGWGVGLVVGVDCCLTIVASSESVGQATSGRRSSALRPSVTATSGQGHGWNGPYGRKFNRHISPRRACNELRVEPVRRSPYSSSPSINPNPTSYQQVEQIDIYLTAKVATGGSDDAVVIVSVDQLRFWIDNNLSGQNGVYNVGETTQLGVAGGVLQGTTTKVPSSGVCNQAFAPAYDTTPPAGS
jgi:hypothetical protein